MFAAAAAGQVSVEVESPSVPMEPTNHNIELGFSTGVFLPASDHELYDSLGTDHRAYDAVNPTIALRLGYFPWRFVGVEGEGAYMPSQDSEDDLANLFALRGHGVLQWPMRLTPFAVVGGGMLASTGSTGNDVDQAFHWGLGAKFYAYDWLSVRLDARHIYTGGQGPGAGNTNHFEVLAGVSFTVYRAPPPEEPWARVDVGPAPPPTAAPAAPAPEPEPVSRKMSVATSTPAVVVRQALEKVHFKFGSAELGPQTHSALDLAADVLRRNRKLRVRIVGHTDHVGSDEFNQRLSIQRAQAVKDYLVDAGIAPERLLCEGKGEAMPIAPNDSAYGRALNRRSEFNIDLMDEGPPDTGGEGTPP